MEVPETAKEDILFGDDKGLNKFEEFVSQKLVASTAKKSIWDTTEIEMKLKTVKYVSEKDKLQRR